MLIAEITVEIDHLADTAAIHQIREAVLTKFYDTHLGITSTCEGTIKLEYYSD